MARRVAAPSAPVEEEVKAPARRAAPVKESTSRAVVNWEEQMEKDAQVAAEMEKNTGGGQFFSVRGGQLSFNGATLPGNEMIAVVVDSIFENAFYEGKFDPDSPTPPTCFAFDRVEEDLKPHEVVFQHEQAQNETCHGCPMNQWASADTGRGKACKNARRLALISAGQVNQKTGDYELEDEEGAFAKAPMGFLKVPVTSVAAWGSMVKQVAGTFKRPPHGIYMHVKVVPDAKTQFKVQFTPLDKLPNEVMAAVMARREEAMATIEQPYNLDQEPAAAPAKTSARGRTPPPVKRGGAKKF
jgi:hypothetical protein